tara:strand:+ start:141 stop:1121 length:981 start_codon:yes stop_codon:yes gene_type:complete
MASIKRRNGKYQVTIRRKGYAPLYKTFISLSIARKWITVTEADMERQLFQSTSQVTVNEILDRYIQQILPTHRNGGISERYRLQRLKGEFGKLPLHRLTPMVIAQYRDMRLASVSSSTVRRELGVLRSAINIATREWGITLAVNPVAAIKMPIDNLHRTRRLEPGEQAQLLAGASDQLQRIIVLALETALRRGEILNIYKQDIDWSRRTLHIPTTKTDQPRTIPLSTTAVEAIGAQLRTAQNVLPIKATPLFSLRTDSLTRAFLRACRRVGITNLRFHDLRHEATSRLFEKGLNPVEVATITGHKDTRMLMRYTHLRAEDLVVKLD